MKNTVKIILAVAALVGMTSTLNAQSVRLPGDKVSVEAPVNSAQALELATEITTRASNARSVSFDAQAVKGGSINTAVMAQVELMPQAIDNAITGFAIKAGASKFAVKTATASLIDEQTMSVRINYEERPIGGILNVQVSMMPSFQGVGVTSRPTISRSVAQAVDGLSDEMVKQIVRDLTREIRSEFAAM